MAGPWVIEPRGLAVFGNPISSPVPAACEQKLQALQTDGPDPSTNLVTRLDSGCDRQRVITPEEVCMLQRLLNQGEEVWELLKEFHGGRLQFHRHRNRKLFSGALFGRISAHLPRGSKEMVAHAVNNFEERAKWDKQVAGFRMQPVLRGNDVVHLRMHAPPFSDRDFVAFHMLARHTGGAGFLSYQRAADDSFVPPGNNVRGSFVNALVVTDHPSGGVKFVSTSVLDPNMRLIPAWLINVFIPSEVAKWIDTLEAHMDKLVAQGLKLSSLPCVTAGLFKPEIPAPALRSAGAAEDDAKIGGAAAPTEASTEAEDGLADPAKSISSCSPTTGGGAGGSASAGERSPWAVPDFADFGVVDEDKADGEIIHAEAKDLLDANRCNNSNNCKGWSWLWCSCSDGAK
eukprot:gnl/TRDRNA2_/TRDRNA2_154285_c0_seq1.p1 gnl/TRDRNA2_/TRDRNA2_154285_c0~~gnl/TRDRNA2_/TRDRNA2_154285_c0_seq1.p1  ORF type:complete len:401 (+),score=76.27 gnl/TRDRNA2_/TRDRNA2_154285_c0_seq1:87-1289(+)